MQTAKCKRPPALIQVAVTWGPPLIVHWPVDNKGPDDSALLQMCAPPVENWFQLSAKPVEVSRTSAEKSQLHICGTLLPQIIIKQTQRAWNPLRRDLPRGRTELPGRGLGRGAVGRDAGLRSMPAGRGAA